MSFFPTKILVATDGSEDAEMALASAVVVAKGTDSELHLLTVARGYFSYDVRNPEVVEQLQKQAQDILDEQAAKVERGGGEVAGKHLKIAEPYRAEQIVRAAEDLGAGLIVMGSRGLGGMQRALMGSVSDSVVRHAHCPVLVVRGEPISFPMKILLATDGSKDAELAATAAVDLARNTDSELHVVTVFPGSAYVHPYYETHFPEAAERLRREARKERQEMLDERAERIREAGGSVAHTHIRAGEPAAEIVTMAEEIEADLIAIGSRGLGGIRRALVGSVSDLVVRYAHCPVLVVRE
jgi:nucleotide-binding universal stress UspA family protein